MQICKNCGRNIKYIAIGNNKSIACDSERLEFITDNGFKKSGYLIHKCEKPENKNGKSE